MGFFTGFLSGAVFAGTAVLFTNKRTGKENIDLSVNYIEDVSEGLEEFRDAGTQLTEQVKKVVEEFGTVQTVIAPGLEEDLDSFSADVDHHLRKINEDLKMINEEVENFNKE